ncbi:MAG: TetR/AcrR family transcriptional regulator [Brotaphodocola sp.]
MKREEKNQKTRRRIMDSALAEFSKQGYGASSINTICAAENISKGIIYHYFDTKDALFLACVDECFALLTDHIREHMEYVHGSVEEQLKAYFTSRMDFFQKQPVYQRIFCEAVISPPAHLWSEVQKRKRDFDLMNIQILERLLAPVVLRPQITKAEVIETFRQFQDFINAKYQMTEVSASEFSDREESCRKALNILLYGVIERKEENHG